MKKFRNYFLYVLLFIIITFGFLYSFFLFVFPAIANSGILLKTTNYVLKKNTNLKVSADKIYLKTYPNLSLDLISDKIILNDKDTELLTAKNIDLSYDLQKLNIKSLNIDYIFLNEKGFKNFLLQNKKKTPSDFKFKKFPSVTIKQAEVWIENGDINNIFLLLSDFNIINSNDSKTYFTFKAEIISDLLRNIINIGKNGYLCIDDNSLYAKDLQVLVGVSKLNIDGKIIDDDKNVDFSVKGDDIPIQDIEASLLYFQKVQSKGKKFLENFYDFSGEMDVDIKINNSGAFGSCIAKNLSAITVLFDVPVLFKKYVFNFNGRNIEAADFGLFGGEKVYNEFKISDIATKNQEVSGYVSSNITDKLADKYIPDVSIKGYANTSVRYSVKNHKIYVNYLLKLKNETDLYYKDAYLGLENKNRRLLVNTLKEGSRLSISHYDYSIQDGSDIANIILGTGLLEKQNGHFEPSYITCKTNGYAPVSVTGSFGKYIDGGEFNGDLKYDFNKELLIGSFNIRSSKYKDFYLQDAIVNADNKIFNVKAFGTYNNSPFECKLNAENNFSSQINVYDMYLFLDELILEKLSSNKTNKNKSKKIVQQAKELDITIQKWTIKLNRIRKKRIELTNILLNGSLKEDIFSFSMPHVNFAKGKLSSKGVYNFKDNSSNILFEAENIDSNIVADVIFNLPHQIEGIANAVLSLETKNGLEDIKAQAKFSVKRGYLPLIGNVNFLAKKSILNNVFSFKVSDILKIDVKNIKDLSANIEGSFSLDNSKIKDVKITSSQKYLSMLIDGYYNLDTQNADIQIFGKYNNKQIHRVKVFFVPLSWIVRFVFRPENSLLDYADKLKEVPAIEAIQDETTSFKVKMNGNLNKKDLNIELKRLQ